MKNMNIIERKKALEVLLQQKTAKAQTLESQRNNTVTEIVKIQGKLELLKELEIEEKKQST